MTQATNASSSPIATCWNLTCIKSNITTKCLLCTEALYCSDGCKKTHWPSHWPVCRLNQKLLVGGKNVEVSFPDKLSALLEEWGTLQLDIKNSERKNEKDEQEHSSIEQAAQQGDASFYNQVRKYASNIERLSSLHHRLKELENNSKQMSKP